MSKPTLDKNGFLQLWPTQFLQREIPNADEANQLLLQLILQQEQQHQNAQSEQGIKNQDMTSDYLSANLFEIDNPVIDWLKACINKSVSDYLLEQGINYDVEWGLQGWANINRRGDYHNMHNHPHSYLSGTYYVQMPQSNAIDSIARADLNPGAISFFDPRSQANMLSIRNDAQIDPEHRVLPKAGMIILWPSFLHHLVHPNLSDQMRVSISFNIVLKWKDEYLPQ